MSTSSTGTDLHIHREPISVLNPTTYIGTIAIRTLKRKPTSKLEQSFSLRNDLGWANTMDASSNNSCLPINIIIGTPATTIETNLYQTKNMCHYVRSHHEAMKEAANTGQYIGYLETTRMNKHRFYVQERNPRIERHVSQLHSIFDAMRCDVPVEDALNITDQV